MTTLLPEDREEYKSIVRRILAMNPTINATDIHKRLKTAETPIDISYYHILDLMKEVRAERIKKINEETKEELYAEVAELVDFINGQLRAIAQEEKLVYTKTKDGVPSEKAETRIFAQNNRIKALNSIVDNALRLIELKMDLGIVERKVGSLDVSVVGIMGTLKKIRNGDYSTPLDQLLSSKTGIQS